MENLKFIETLDAYGEDTKKYILVDRNALGEIFITVKNKKTISNAYDVVWLELSRESAFDLAQQILSGLVSFPEDQIERLEQGLDCSCKHYKEYTEELAEG